MVITEENLDLNKAKECYEFTDSNSCNSAKAPLYCEWADNSVHIENGVESRGYCQEVSCYNYQTEEECSSAVSGLGCKWDNSFNNCRGENSQTAYESCNKLMLTCFMSLASTIRSFLCASFESIKAAAKFFPPHTGYTPQ